MAESGTPSPVNSLSPQMSELVKDAIASWCCDIVGQFWFIRNELQKFVKLKFEFFRFTTFNVSQIFWQWIVQMRPQYSYCIFLKGLCCLSVCWILNNALFQVLGIFSFLFCAPLSNQYWVPYAVFSSKIYNYITHCSMLLIPWVAAQVVRWSGFPVDSCSNPGAESLVICRLH